MDAFVKHEEWLWDVAVSKSASQTAVQRRNKDLLHYNTSQSLLALTFCIFPFADMLVNEMRECWGQRWTEKKREKGDKLFSDSAFFLSVNMQQWQIKQVRWSFLRNKPWRSNQDPNEYHLNGVYFAIVTEWLYATTYQMNKCMEIKWLIIQACVLYKKNWPANQNKMFV